MKKEDFYVRNVSPTKSTKANPESPHLKPPHTWRDGESKFVLSDAEDDGEEAETNEFSNKENERSVRFRLEEDKTGKLSSEDVGSPIGWMN